MISNHERIVIIQIFKENQWIDYHQTYDDPNAIRRIISMINSQIADIKLRLCDKSGGEINIEPYLKKMPTRYKGNY